MTRYERTVENADGWSDWFSIPLSGWKMRCCDCALVHDFDFRIVKGKLEFRASRDKRATAASRRHKRLHHEGNTP